MVRATLARQTFHIHAICGSLRSGSYNRALLRVAAEVAPATVVISIADSLREVPPFDADGEPTAAVHDLKAAVRACDALLIASPEYNAGPPGVLKNAIDWLSDPMETSPLVDKPVALLGASVGSGGTMRAQLALRQNLQYTRSHVLPRPEVLVAHAHERFDSQGRLMDAVVREAVRQALLALVAWTVRLRRGRLSAAPTDECARRRVAVGDGERLQEGWSNDD